MAGKWAFLLASVLSAEEISIGVFSLFRPEALVVQGNADTATGEFVLEIPERIARRFRGKLAVTKSNGILSPVVSMDLETAVAAAVAAEMPDDAPLEALKALAVLVRSFYTSSKGRHAGYDFCDTTHCQFHREPPPPEHPASRAARETSGIFVTYRGRRFAPMYSASCGGSTFRAEDVGLTGDPYPYEGVRCSKTDPQWTRTLPRDVAGPLLESKSETARLTIARKLGWSALPSNNYTVRASDNEIIFTGRGQGHGVGLCQRGAIALASTGAGFRTILRHYLPNTDLR